MCELNFPSDGMTVSGDFTLLSPQRVLSPESIKILTCYMSENRPAKTVDPPEVVFYGVQETASSTEKFNCCFTFIADDVRIGPGDIVALCRLGWKRLRDILYYVPAEIHFLDRWITLYTVTFEVDNLPKDFGPYELCYISGGKILGTSESFTFVFPDTPGLTENDFIGVEDPHDPGLIVFKSRCSKSSDETKYFDDGLANSNVDSFQASSFEKLIDDSMKGSQVSAVRDNEQNELLKIGEKNQENQSVKNIEVLSNAQNESREINNSEQEDQSATNCEVLSNVQNESREINNCELQDHTYTCPKEELSDSHSSLYSMPELIGTFSLSSGDICSKDIHHYHIQEVMSEFNENIEVLSNVQNESREINNCEQEDQSATNCEVLSNVQNESREINNCELQDHTYTCPKEELSNSHRSLYSLPELIGALSLSSGDAYSKNLQHNGIQEVMSELNEVRAAVDEVAKLLPLAFEHISSSLKNVSNTAGSSTQSLSPNVFSVLIPSGTKVDSINVQPNSISEQDKSKQPFSQVQNSCGCLLYKNKSKENDELHEKLKDLKETNAFLKSRISVLELELCTLNEKKYSILMQCITSYEQENASLKEELDILTKTQCEIESLKFKWDKVSEENTELKKFIINCPSFFSTNSNSKQIQENKMLKAKCSHLESQNPELHNSIEEDPEKTSKTFKHILLKQDHELVSFKSVCQNICGKLHKIRKSFHITDKSAMKWKEWTKLKTELKEIETQLKYFSGLDQEVAQGYDETKVLKGHLDDMKERQQMSNQMACMRKEMNDIYKQNMALKEQLGKVSLQ